ncbi:sensor histidine kinase [Paenibacillus psychroresistens]|uniref:histidine kinase n=1 Tax=Paenibacillus psychroresistens TaxID=1778678 RepID=A0A6B8RGZ2_9BACL|nr:ATP-binding protein [Paenibacillus psychroresistens]QGQ94865.1 sensor histidine kinase [Paenibacillus psychroresistens]
MNKIFPFNWIGDLVRLGVRTSVLVRTNIRRSIRLQLMVAFLICFFAAWIVYGISGSFFGEVNRSPVIEYSQGIRQIDDRAQNMVERIKNESRFQEDITVTQHVYIADSDDGYNLQDYLDGNINQNSSHVLILDLDGKVIYKSSNATENHVDVYKMISQAMDTRSNPYERTEITSFYPLDIVSQKMYLVLIGIPEPSITYSRGKSPLTLLFAVAAFIFLFYLLTRRKMQDIEALTEGLLQIAKGNLKHRVVEKSEDELGSLAANINHMTGELQRTIEEERNAERTKNELITNVSHDLRTPLTLIIGYLRLLKDKNYDDQVHADSYINIAYNKSEKLNRLIDDLFDYTKFSNHSVPMQIEKINLNELIDQLLEEQISYAEENNLIFVRELPSSKMFVAIDADQMIRVFDNLLANAIKYSDKPGEVTVRLTRVNEFAEVRIINRATGLNKDELPHVFDRFYRLDAARTSDTGGSGLGLAIAKSIVEAHQGEIWTHTEQDEIHFCMRLKLAL